MQVSTHAPLARRDVEQSEQVITENVSTHAPLARRDQAHPHLHILLAMFQLTRLLRGATLCCWCCGGCVARFNSRASCEARREVVELGSCLMPVSTHAPLARRDAFIRCSSVRPGGFNSRASCEARPLRWSFKMNNTKFQLTRLLRGATFLGLVSVLFSDVSTHAPLARRDRLTSL